MLLNVKDLYEGNKEETHEIRIISKFWSKGKKNDLKKKKTHTHLWVCLCYYMPTCIYARYTYTSVWKYNRINL